MSNLDIDIVTRAQCAEIVAAAISRELRAMAILAILALAMGGVLGAATGLAVIGFNRASQEREQPEQAPLRHPRPNGSTGNIGELSK